MKSWQKHTITGLIVVTLPIWFIPAMLLALVALVVGGIYLDIHARLWDK
jgi:uncharacterized membrane protein